MQEVLELLTVSDVGRLVDRTPEAIRAAVAAGRLQVAMRTRGGVRLFTRAEADRFAVAIATRRSHEASQGA